MARATNAVTNPTLKTIAREVSDAIGEILQTTAHEALAVPELQSVTLPDDHTAKPIR